MFSFDNIRKRSKGQLVFFIVAAAASSVAVRVLRRLRRVQARVAGFRATMRRQGWKDSNPRPTVLETAALPTELHPSARRSLPTPDSRAERRDHRVRVLVLKALLITGHFPADPGCQLGRRGVDGLREGMADT